MQFISYALDSQYGYSMWIYMLIFTMTSTFAFLSARNKTIIIKTVHRKRYINLWFAFSFFTAWFFYLFADIGTDLKQYLAIYNGASFTSNYFLYHTVEKGYLVINATLNLLFKNPLIGVGIIKTIILICFFGGLYSLREKIHIGYSVMAFMAIYYFQGYNLIRLSLAAGICFISLILMYKNKKLLSLFLAIATFWIHRSALIFICVLLFYFVFKYSKSFKPLLRFLLIISIPLLIFFGGDIILYLIQYDAFHGRYDNYMMGAFTSGIGQILFYIPAFIMLFICFRNNDIRKSSEYELSFIWVISGFIVAMLGYKFGMLARAEIIFSAVYMFFIPYYLKNKKTGHIRGAVLNYSSASIIMTIYWIIRFILNISGLFFTSGLNEFTFVW